MIKGGRLVLWDKPYLMVNDTYAMDIEVEGVVYHYLLYSKDQRIRFFTREYDYNDQLFSVTLFVTPRDQAGGFFIFDEAILQLLGACFE